MCQSQERLRRCRNAVAGAGTPLRTERCDRLRSSGGTATREEVIRNEATLRYTIGDPIMDMFCDMEGLKVIHNDH